MALATQVHASLIELGPGRLSYTEVFPFHEFNGAVNQHVSVDLMFDNNIHLFTHTSQWFLIGLTFLAKDPQFLEGTGYLLDINGNQLGGVRSAAGAIGDDGSEITGIFPLIGTPGGALATDISRPLDFYGVHFDFDIPDEPIIDGIFYMTTPDYGESFRIGPHVTDNGTTLMLFLLSLIGLVLYDKKANSLLRLRVIARGMTIHSK